MSDIIPPRRGQELTPDGKATIRFSEYLENLTSITNDTTSKVDATPIDTTMSLIFAIQQRIGSGFPLTSDETGFTVDSTRLTVDRTEA